MVAMRNYNPVTKEVIEALKAVVGAEHVFADEELRILKETPEAFNKIITSIMENQYEK